MGDAAGDSPDRPARNVSASGTPARTPAPVPSPRGRRDGEVHVVAAPERRRPRIDVVLVDDHQLLADGVVRLLEREPDIAVVGVAGSCADGMPLIRALRPSVVLLDFVLPDGDGLAMAERLQAEQPGLKIVLLSGSGRTSALNGAVQAACAGYVDKTRAYHELVGVVRAVAAGKTVYPLDELARMPRVEQLRVHYQPVIDLRTDRPIGVEALVRWEDPARGLVPPLEFIAAAEESGFITILGAAVLKESCRQAVAWRTTLPCAEELSVAVNVSPTQLEDDAFPRRVIEVLEETELPPEALVIEVTETGVAEDPRAVVRRLAALKELGVQLAIDDFGTGYASLQQLATYPMDLLKVDRHFVAGLPTQKDDRAIVEATVRLAHDLALTVVAEGIEAPEHVQALRALGCELGQGYLYSRPLPADELARWWLARMQALPVQALTTGR